MNIKLLATTLVGLAALNITFIHPVNATPISNVTVSTDMGQVGSFDLQDTVNESGLSEDAPASKDKAIEGKTNSNQTTVRKHRPSGTSNAWFSDPDQSTGIIEFQFNKVYALTGFDYWNASGEAAPHGIQNVTISTSIDGVDFTVLKSAPTQFAQASSSKKAQLPQSFSWQSVQAKYVRFQVHSNFTQQAGSASGFSEIQFQTPFVPIVAAKSGAVLPSGLAAGIGLLGLLSGKGTPPSTQSSPPTQSPTPSPTTSSTPTPKPSTIVPTPALLPGLAGMAIVALRKRRHKKANAVEK